MVKLYSLLKDKTNKQQQVEVSLDIVITLTEIQKQGMECPVRLYNSNQLVQTDKIRIEKFHHRKVLNRTSTLKTTCNRQENETKHRQ